MKRADLTAERLRERLQYKPETGDFIWLKSRYSNLIGATAGSPFQNGYWGIRVDGELYGAHRLAWLYVNGSWPTNEIDHIDGNRRNNKLENLRDVSKSVNAQNLRRARRNSRSGYLGVSKIGSGWRAHIKVNGEVIRLGIYSSVKEAHDAYLEAKRELHPGCTI